MKELGLMTDGLWCRVPVGVICDHRGGVEVSVGQSELKEEGTPRSLGSRSGRGGAAGAGR